MSAEDIEIYYKCPACGELRSIDKEKDIEFTGSMCDTCGYIEFSLATNCPCGAIIETVLHDGC